MDNLEKEELSKLLSNYDIDSKTLNTLYSDIKSESRKAFYKLAREVINTDYRPEFDKANLLPQESTPKELAMYNAKKNYYCLYKKYEDVKRLYQIRKILYQGIYISNIEEMIKIGKVLLTYRERINLNLKGIDINRQAELEEEAMQDVRKFFQDNKFLEEIEYLDKRSNDNVNKQGYKK